MTDVKITCFFGTFPCLVRVSQEGPGRDTGRLASSDLPHVENFHRPDGLGRFDFLLAEFMTPAPVMSGYALAVPSCACCEV